MSNTIPVAMVRQYHSNVIFLYQQEMSVLRGKMAEKSLKGRYDFFDRIGPTTAVKKDQRFMPTPRVNTQHSRRRGELVDYVWSDTLDKEDDMRILIDPLGSYAQNASMAMARAYDSEAIEAFTADAYEGETGATVTSFPAGNIIEDGGGGTGLTVAKLMAAKLAMDLVPVPLTDRHFLYSPEASLDLLVDPQVTSSDFNTVQALVAGQLTGTYLGFQYHTSILLPVASNIRECYAWHRDSMGMMIGKDLDVRVDELPTVTYATQVFVSGSFKGIRILDEGVRVIDIDESV